MSLESDYIAAITAGDTNRANMLAHQLDIESAADAAQRAQQQADPWRLAKAAIWYAEQGVPIFPIARNGKRPLLPRAHADVVEQSTCPGDCGREGHGFRDSTLDPVKIRAWWSHNPRANIGMPTGQLFDVWDVDGPEGINSMWGDYPMGPYEYFAQSLGILGRVTTPRPGGYHVYTKPAGRINGTEVLRGVDFRGEGGYVLLPPSYVVTDDYAGEYEWRLRPDFG